MSVKAWSPRDRDLPFETCYPCPNCAEALVNVTHAGDGWIVLMCTYHTCINQPLYALVDGKPVEFCLIHNTPNSVCGCPPEEL